jgi:hypothetical protein
VAYITRYRLDVEGEPLPFIHLDFKPKGSHLEIARQLIVIHITRLDHLQDATPVVLSRVTRRWRPPRDDKKELARLTLGDLRAAVAQNSAWPEREESPY